MIKVDAQEKTGVKIEVEGTPVEIADDVLNIFKSVIEDLIPELSEETRPELLAAIQSVVCEILLKISKENNCMDEFTKCLKRDVMKSLKNIIDNLGDE